MTVNKLVALKNVLKKVKTKALQFKKCYRLSCSIVKQTFELNFELEPERRKNRICYEYKIDGIQTKGVIVER